MSIRCLTSLRQCRLTWAIRIGTQEIISSLKWIEFSIIYTNKLMIFACLCQQGLRYEKLGRSLLHSQLITQPIEFEVWNFIEFAMTNLFNIQPLHRRSKQTTLVHLYSLRTKCMKGALDRGDPNVTNKQYKQKKFLNRQTLSKKNIPHKIS